MGGNPGGQGGGGVQGDVCPHDLEGGGHNIKCPPPPHGLGVVWSWLFIQMRTLLSCELSGAVSPPPFFCCLSERLVMYDGHPVLYSVSGKLTPQNLRSENKCRCPSPPPPTPPPPLPPLINFFSGLARLSKLAADRLKKWCAPPPPPPWSDSDFHLYGDCWTKSSGVFAEMQIISYSFIILNHFEINSQFWKILMLKVWF